ncbi:hypothetical protein V866_005406 [Kwoniella sp. B9012]
MDISIFSHTCHIRPTTSTSPIGDLIVPPFQLHSAETWLTLACKNAYLISTWIEIVAHEAVNWYGKGQMGKIWEAIEREGLVAGKIKGDSEAARQRLKLVLEKWRRGEVEVPIKLL